MIALQITAITPHGVVLSRPWGIALDGLLASARHCHVGERGRPGRIGGVSSATPSYKGHRYPVEIINHCVWLYFRFPLSFREVKELMLARGVVVSYETIWRWCAKVRAGLRQPATSTPPTPRRQVAPRRGVRED